MFSIKNSFANCIECPLFSEPSCILETNVKYLNEVNNLIKEVCVDNIK